MKELIPGECNNCKWRGDDIPGYGNREVFYCLEPEVLENIGYVHKRNEQNCGRFSPNSKMIRKEKLEKINEKN